jgi:hypothetical protein
MKKLLGLVCALTDVAFYNFLSVPRYAQSSLKKSFTTLVRGVTGFPRPPVGPGRRIL